MDVSEDVDFGFYLCYFLGEGFAATVSSIT